MTNERSRLLKGVEFSRYRLQEKLSQGKREWFDAESAPLSSAVRMLVERKRIAIQRITGVDERWRVVGSVIEPVTYFADSTNSISTEDACPFKIELILGILNSRFVQWRFKLTSTNNNVGSNELDGLPFPRPSAVSNGVHDRMVELVQRMLELHEQKAAVKTDHDRANLQRQIDATDTQIDRLVYDLYGLTEAEIEIVEEATQ